MNNDYIEYEWVIAVYTGDRAKSVKSHADNGIGYFVREERGKGVNYELEVAFRRPIDGPRPDHLIAADVITSSKLDEKYQQRHGLQERRDSDFMATPKDVLRDIQPARKTQLADIAV